MRAWIIGAWLIGGMAVVLPAAADRVIDGVSFAGESGVLYAPAREIAEGLDWPVRWDGKRNTAYLNRKPVPKSETRRLLNDTLLVAVRDLEGFGADVRWDAERNMARVAAGDRELWVRLGPKRVAINRAAQRLRAWQGDRLVLETRVSTGRRGHATPTGSFRAGPYRARMHYSSLYDNAPMPWSVQVRGNVFLHGFESVPPRAASHGCVRIPLSGGNPAKWLYRWIDTGTPIRIADGWASS